MTNLTQGSGLLLFREALPSTLTAEMVAALYEFTHVCTQSFYVLATLSDYGTGILSREAVVFFDGVFFVRRVKNG